MPGGRRSSILAAAELQLSVTTCILSSVPLAAPATSMVMIPARLQPLQHQHQPHEVPPNNEPNVINWFPRRRAYQVGKIKYRSLSDPT